MELTKLKQKLKTQIAEQKFRNDLDSSIQHTQRKIQAKQREEDKALLQLKRQERRELMEKQLIESKAFFVCPRCKRKLEVSAGRSGNDSRMQMHVIIEAKCVNPKCSIKPKFQENMDLAQPLLHTFITNRISEAKNLIHKGVL